MDRQEINRIASVNREWILATENIENLGEHDLRLIGKSDIRGSFYFRRPHPLFGQILVCLSGTGHVLTSGGMVELKPNQAYITPPYRYHAYNDIQGEEWSLAWAMLAPPFMNRHLTGEEPIVLHANAKSFETIISGLYLETLMRPNVHRCRLWMELLKDLCLEILQSPSPPLRLSFLWETVDRHLAHPWNNEKLSEIANLSEGHLRRLCLAETALPPMKQVTKLRMLRAAAFLSNSKMTNSQIGRRIGYDNQFAFSTAFKRFFGQSPEDYRQSSRHPDAG